MGAYESFARVYDRFMDNVPYEEWAARITDILAEHGIRDGLVLDLGCGTGNMTMLLSKAGYDMIGVDNAPQMLQIAQEKLEGSGQDILYLLQDMRSFELYGTVRAVVCVCDSLNYITSEEELRQVFSLVNNYLDPGGVFLFDMNTLYKYRELLGDETFAENRREGSFIWENTWYEEERINEYELTLFLEETSGLYRKYTETHFQKGYGTEQILRLLKESGLETEDVREAFSGDRPGPETERLCFIAREHGKGNRNS